MEQVQTNANTRSAPELKLDTLIDLVSGFKKLVGLHMYEFESPFMPEGVRGFKGDNGLVAFLYPNGHLTILTVEKSA